MGGSQSGKSGGNGGIVLVKARKRNWHPIRVPSARKYNASRTTVSVFFPP